MRLFFVLILFLISLSKGNDIGSLNSVQWTSTGIEAVDVGVGAEGDMYVIGTDDLIYQYEFKTNSYISVDGDFELLKPTRIDVDENGTPYVIANCGKVYYLDFFNHWVELDGCASDIGVGRGSDVWKIGCDEKSQGGFGIWKLICEEHQEEPSTYCEREQIRFRKLTYLFSNLKQNHKNTAKHCFWYRIEGEGTRIDVSPDGLPYIIGPGNVVMKYEDPNWLGIFGNYAVDLTVSNEGLLFIVDLNGNIHRVITEELGTWEQVNGNAIAISAGPYSQPLMIGKQDNIVYTSSKFTYN